MNAPQIIVPPLGSFWKEQGGIYIGEMLGENGNPNHHVILPIDDRAKLGDRKWGKYGELIKGCDHIRDGRANTLAMAEANNELAQEILELKIDGLGDLHFPSQAEAYYCFAVARDQFEKRWHWTSTQYSANYAWIQHFEHGIQYYYGKGHEFAVRVVRRLIIQ